MYLENIVVDCRDPERLARFWAGVLGTSVDHNYPREADVRLAEWDGQPLDLCFVPVPEDAAGAPRRLHLDLRGGPDQEQVARRALGLGARALDIGQGNVPWQVMADPEGNPFCVMDDRPWYRAPVAAIPIDSADPDRDALFWELATGWEREDHGAVPALRHPSGEGPLLEFCPEAEPKRGKNRMHLDLRLEASDDGGAVVAHLLAEGASRVEHDWGDLSWSVLADPSGNEFCVLPAA